MTPIIAFLTITLIVLPQWILMIVQPDNKRTQQLVDSDIIPFLLLVIYVVVIAQNGAALQINSVADILHIFQMDNLVLAAWAFIGFLSLLVSSWCFNRLQELEIKENWVMPSLLITFMSCPLLIGAIVHF